MEIVTPRRSLIHRTSRILRSAHEPLRDRLGRLAKQVETDRMVFHAWR